MGSYSLIKNCIIYDCQTPLTDYEFMKQTQHPKTQKYLMCKKHRNSNNQHISYIFKCQVCTNIFDDRPGKYCKECRVEVQKKQMHDNYVKKHPRGECHVCFKKLTREQHGRKTAYCSDECYRHRPRKRYPSADNWKKRNPEKVKAMQAEYNKRPEVILARKGYMKKRNARLREITQLKKKGLYTPVLFNY